jgi:hypothetical protein
MMVTACSRLLFEISEEHAYVSSLHLSPKKDYKKRSSVNLQVSQTEIMSTYVPCPKLSVVSV